MDDFILKITAEIVITQEDVDDIMSTALDSSMLQCWCSEELDFQHTPCRTTTQISIE